MYGCLSTDVQAADPMDPWAMNRPMLIGPLGVPDSASHSWRCAGRFLGGAPCSEAQQSRRNAQWTKIATWFSL
jgi:hypothetical protein